MHKMFITKEAKDSLDDLVKKYDTEVSGLGTVEKVNKKIVITDIFILKQMVSPNYSGLVNEAITEYVTGLAKNGWNPGNVKVWWHSHGWQDVGWNPLDEDTINGFQNGWMVSLVVNKNKESKARIDTFKPRKTGSVELEVVASKNLVFLRG